MLAILSDFKGKKWLGLPLLAHGERDKDDRHIVFSQLLVSTFVNDCLRNARTKNIIRSYKNIKSFIIIIVTVV